MRIITCAGYYGTGSSAVSNLFSEFSNCYCPGEYEFRFIHDPDGIRDLEYNLIENNNRHNTGNAIKRYLKLAKHLNGNAIRKCYSRYLGKDTFMEMTYEFINQITELKYHAWWHFDQIEKGELFFLLDTVYSRIRKSLFSNYKSKDSRYSLLELMNEQTYISTIDKDKFYICVKNYIQKIMEALNKEKSEFLMIDQLLPPSNLGQYLNYFNDIKVIVTDRDPRDIFILANEEWHEQVIPYSDVQLFCKWYEITRRHRKKEKYDQDKVYFLRFEDMIYKYNETITDLIRFSEIGEKNHTIPKLYFKPDISVKNTNLKTKYSKYYKEISYIEQNLKEYLYPFSDTQ